MGAAPPLQTDYAPSGALFPERGADRPEGGRLHSQEGAAVKAQSLLAAVNVPGPRAAVRDKGYGLRQVLRGPARQFAMD